MANATHTAPIGIENINTTYFVAGSNSGGFATIQGAVDFIRTYASGIGQIVICHGHPYNEDIGSLTGGTTSIYILDQRDGLLQQYHWDGTKFVPLAFVQIGDITTTVNIHGSQAFLKAMNTSLYVWADNNFGFSSAQAAIDYLQAISHVGIVDLIFGSEDTNNISTLTNGGVDIIVIDHRHGRNQNYVWDGAKYIPQDFTQLGAVIATRGKFVGPVELITDQTQTPELYGLWIGNAGVLDPGAKGLLFTPRPSENLIDLQGEMSPSGYQDIRLNRQGGDVFIGPNATITEGGEVQATLGKFLGPVRLIVDETQTPELYGLWIGNADVSDPGAKGLLFTPRPSEDLIDLQGEMSPSGYQDIRLNRQGGNVFIGPNAEITEDGSVHATRGKFLGPVRLAIDQTQTPGGGALWIGNADVTDPGAKGLLFTPRPSEDLIDIQGEMAPSGYQTIRLNQQGGTVTVNNSPVRTFANTPDGGGMVFPGTGIGVSTGTAWGTSIDPLTIQGKLTLTTTGTSGPSTLAGNVFNVPQYAGGGMVFPGAGIGVSTGSAWGTSINPATLATYPSAGIAVSTGSAWGAPLDPANLTNVAYLNKANAFTQTQSFGAGAASIDASGNLTTPILKAGASAGGNLQINSQGTGSVLINWGTGGGTGHTIFANGAGTGVAHIYLDGSAVFAGTITASGKSFRIPHPLDETKDLVHSCLEGPEWGVYYRGEVVTENGSAIVTLPDYFEALTFIEDRTVQLTQVVEAGGGFSMVAASRVVDGKFTVHSSVPSATVAWQVNAIRRFGENKLEVVTARQEPEPIPQPVK